MLKLFRPATFGKGAIVEKDFFAVSRDELLVEALASQNLSRTFSFADPSRQKMPVLVIIRRDGLKQTFGLN